MTIFAFVALGIWGLLNAYVGWRLIGPAAPPGWPKAAAWGALAFVAVLIPAAMILGRVFASSKGATALATCAFAAVSVLAMILALVVLRDLALLALRGGAAAGRLLQGYSWAAGAAGACGRLRGAFLSRTATLTILGLAAVLAAAGYVQSRLGPRIERVSVPVPGLPASLEGFSIAQIADTHVGGGSSRGELIAEVVAMVNALEPDAIAMTGDLADGSVEDLGRVVAPLGALAARHGKFFVTGNHEYYSGVEEWVAEVRRLGFRVLCNENVAIDRDGGLVAIAGVPDRSAGWLQPGPVSDPRKALDGAPEGAVKILLAHQPLSAPAAAEAGYDLVLCGHTHGGQFYPWKLVVGLVQPFVAGMHRLGGTWIYVSRGAGHWGPPNRLGVPAEVTLFTLTSSREQPHE